MRLNKNQNNFVEVNQKFYWRWFFEILKAAIATVFEGLNIENLFFTSDLKLLIIHNTMY